MTTGACTERDLQACTSGMAQIQSNPGDLNLVCRLVKETLDCLKAKQPSCDSSFKSQLDMAFSQANMMFANCPSGDCDYLKCMSMMSSMPQQEGKFEETCKIARQAGHCFTEQKLKCASNQQAIAQIDAIMPGIQQIQGSCPTENSGKCDMVKFQTCANSTQALALGQSEDKVKKVEACKSLMKAIECIQDAVGSCDMPAVKAMVNQSLSHLETYQAACKTIIEEDEKDMKKNQKEEKTGQTVSTGDGGNGVKQTTQSPVLIVTSTIALLLLAIFNY
ncbi:uncharacterized protein LOC131927126 isoform X2 [Physella acuta]|nr:uncharacterized protein LOC131927126 isoform X2 [Physella acuta]